MNESESTFTDPDLEVHEFRRISGLAITTFVLSIIACAIGIANKNFVFLPLCVAALAVLTLILMHRSIRPMYGFSLAAVALFISLFSFSAISAYHQHRYNHLEQAAIANGQTWLSLLKQNKVYEAYQMHLPVRVRQAAGTDLRWVYGDLENPNENLRRYLELEPEKSIRADGQTANLKLVRVEHDTSRSRTDDFILIYEYKRPNESEPRLFTCYLRRLDSLITGPQWHIIRVNQRQPSITRVLPKELEQALFQM